MINMTRSKYIIICLPLAFINIYSLFILSKGVLYLRPLAMFLGWTAGLIAVATHKRCEFSCKNIIIPYIWAAIYLLFLIKSLYSKNLIFFTFACAGLVIFICIYGAMLDED